MGGIQIYRNPRLVHIFDKLGFIENFDTGIPRTIETYAGYDILPEFKDTGNFFIVTLPNINYFNNDLINGQINDPGLEILKTIKLSPGINVPGLYERLRKQDKDITLDIIRNELRRGLSKYVEHKGSNKTDGYYLIDKKHYNG